MAIPTPFGFSIGTPEDVYRQQQRQDLVSAQQERDDAAAVMQKLAAMGDDDAKIIAELPKTNRPPSGAAAQLIFGAVNAAQARQRARGVNLQDLIQQQIQVPGTPGTPGTPAVEDAAQGMTLMGTPGMPGTPATTRMVPRAPTDMAVRAQQLEAIEPSFKGVTGNVVNAAQVEAARANTVANRIASHVVQGPDGPMVIQTQGSTGQVSVVDPQIGAVYDSIDKAAAGASRGNKNALMALNVLKQAHKDIAPTTTAAPGATVTSQGTGAFPAGHVFPQAGKPLDSDDALLARSLGLDATSYGQLAQGQADNILKLKQIHKVMPEIMQGLGAAIIRAGGDPEIYQGQLDKLFEVAKAALAQQAGSSSMVPGVVPGAPAAAPGAAPAPPVAAGAPAAAPAITPPVSPTGPAVTPPGVGLALSERRPGEFQEAVEVPVPASGVGRPMGAPTTQVPPGVGVPGFAPAGLGAAPAPAVAAPGPAAAPTAAAAPAAAAPAPRPQEPWVATPAKTITRAALPEHIRKRPEAPMGATDAERSFGPGMENVGSDVSHGMLEAIGGKTVSALDADALRASKGLAQNFANYGNILASGRVFSKAEPGSLVGEVGTSIKKRAKEAWSDIKGPSDAHVKQLKIYSNEVIRIAKALGDSARPGLVELARQIETLPHYGDTDLEAAVAILTVSNAVYSRARAYGFSLPAEVVKAQQQSAEVLKQYGYSYDMNSGLLGGGPRMKTPEDQKRQQQLLDKASGKSQ